MRQTAYRFSEPPLAFSPFLEPLPFLSFFAVRPMALKPGERLGSSGPRRPSDRPQRSARSSPSASAAFGPHSRHDLVGPGEIGSWSFVPALIILGLIAMFSFDWTERVRLFHVLGW